MGVTGKKWEREVRGREGIVSESKRRKDRGGVMRRDRHTKREDWMGE